MSLRPCLFLDRDGVINHDPGDYTKNLSEFTIPPTVMEARDRAFMAHLTVNVGPSSANLSLLRFEAVATPTRQLDMGGPYMEPAWLERPWSESQCPPLASTAGTAGFVFDRPWRFHSVWCREADTRGQGTSPVLDLADVDLLGIDNSRLKSSLCYRHPS